METFYQVKRSSDPKRQIKYNQLQEKTLLEEYQNSLRDGCAKYSDVVSLQIVWFELCNVGLKQKFCSFKWHSHYFMTEK